MSNIISITPNLEELYSLQFGDLVGVLTEDKSEIFLLGKVVFIRKVIITDIKIIINVIFPYDFRGQDFSFYSKDESYLVPFKDKSKYKLIKVLYS